MIDAPISQSLNNKFTLHKRNSCDVSDLGMSDTECDLRDPTHCSNLLFLEGLPVIRKLT